jgi:hypothetical protein
MDVPDAPAAPARGLTYKGKGVTLAGVPARDLTADEVKAWLTRAQYDEALASGLYTRAEKADKAAADSKE